MLPRAVEIRARAFGAVLSLGLLVCAALLPGCFSSCTGKPAPPPTAPAAQTPPSPMPAPAVQTPTAPPPGPAVQTPAAPGPAESPAAAASSPPPPKPGLTLEGMRAIREGMTSNEVSEIIGRPGVLIAGTEKASTVFRWNEAGLSFLAKFEDGKLTRKSIFTVKGAGGADGADDRKTIDKDVYDGIQAGMSFEEVLDRIGIEAQPISKTGADVGIYLWRDASGSSFTARFENGTLVKKTGLFVAKGRETVVAEEEAGGAGGAGNAPGNAETSAKADENGAVPENAGQGAEGETDSAASETTPPAPRKGRVTVVGAARREREAESGGGKSDGSYRPKAQLPRNLHRLRDGSYEIRIHNTAESRVKAAVVSQEGTAEVTIAAGGTQSVFVNQGDYVVNFIYDDDPYTLHKGGVIPIGQWLTDMEVFLFGGAYDVQVLDHATDRPPSRSAPAPTITPSRR